MSDLTRTPRHFGPPPVFRSEYVEHAERERLKAIRESIRKQARASYVRSTTGLAGNVATAAKNTKAVTEPWWRELLRRWPERWRK